MAQSRTANRKRRHTRLRKNVRGTGGRPRLSVYKSLSHIYAQVIDDAAGKTIVAASSMEKDIQSSVKHGGNVDAAKKVGASIAKKALGKNIKAVVFDRGGYQYHGCVKALADAAREQGLEF